MLEKSCGKLFVRRISSASVLCGREDSYLEQRKPQELEILLVSYFVANFEWLRANHKVLNKPSLQEVFDTVVIDEAHPTEDESTGKYEVLSKLASRNFIVD